MDFVETSLRLGLTAVLLGGSAATMIRPADGYRNPRRMKWLRDGCAALAAGGLVAAMAGLGVGFDKSMHPSGCLAPSPACQPR